MFKRGTIIVIVILVAGLIALTWYLQQKREAFATSPFGTIPMDAGMVIEAVNLPDLFEFLVTDSEIIDEFSNIDGFSGFNKGLRVIDSLLHLKDFRGYFKNSPVLISFHLLGRDRVVPFFSVAVPPEVKEKHIRETIARAGSLSYGVKEYQGFRIFEIESAKHPGVTVYLSYLKGVLIFSSSHILVEAGIRQSEEIDGITTIPGFYKVSTAAGKNENKVYILFNNLPRILGLLSGDSSGGIAGQISKLASVAECDIYLKKDGFMISGYIEPTDTSHILYRYKSREPGSFDAYTVIPSNAALFECLTGDFEGEAVGHGSPSNKPGYLADIIRSQLEGEVTRVYLDIQGQDIKDNRIILFRLKGSNAVEKSFVDELNSYYREVSIGESQYIIKYKPDDQSEYLIYKIPVDNLAVQICGNFGKKYGGNYATFYDGYIVLSSKAGTLSKYLYDNLLNRTLANDMSYRAFERTMPSRAAYYFYCIPSRTTALMAGLFKESIIKGLDQNMNSLKKIEAVGYQFVASNDMIYNALSVSLASDIREDATSQWESLLDTILWSKPMFFTNHYTGRNEIFVQDTRNNVYLINSSGRILWKLPLKEKITGEPYMIDYYKNGKYQILFSTGRHLHLLDRNGNYVERYPVTMRSPASNGLALFDYENNKDYRLFICGTDRVVYAYNKTGSTIKGWNQFKTSGIVTSDIEFFRVSGKDYLVINDSENMYILDRRGNIRVSPEEPVARAKNSRLRLTSESPSRMVLSANDGSLKFISFHGNVETVTLNEFSGDHIFEYFDIDADGYGEYIFIDNGKIIAYDNNRSRMFVETIGSGPVYGPYGFEFSSNDRKLGFVDSENELIYLINSKGKNVKGFPLRGSTPFSIGRLTGGTSFNLIAGGRDSFLYNYEIKR